LSTKEGCLSSAMFIEKESSLTEVLKTGTGLVKKKEEKTLEKTEGKSPARRRAMVSDV